MDFRRYYVPGSIVFITQAVQYRQPIFAKDENIHLLLETLRNVQALHPFSMLAYVFLPDHFHILILPTGTSNFSVILHSLKPNFTKAYKRTAGIKSNLKFWQKRCWDYVIRDEVDFENQVHYIHYIRSSMVWRPNPRIGSTAVFWLGKKRALTQRSGVGRHLKLKVTTGVNNKM